MRNLRITLIAIAALLHIPSCSTTVPGLLPLPVRQPEGLSVSAGNLVAGQAASFTATWVKGQPPFTVTWQLGGSADPQGATQTIGERTATVTTMLSDNATQITGSVTVTDAYDQSAVTPLNYRLD